MFCVLIFCFCGRVGNDAQMINDVNFAKMLGLYLHMHGIKKYTLIKTSRKQSEKTKIMMIEDNSENNIPLYIRPSLTLSFFTVSYDKIIIILVGATLIIRAAIPRVKPRKYPSSFTNIFSAIAMSRNSDLKVRDHDPGCFCDDKKDDDDVVASICCCAIVLVSVCNRVLTTSMGLVQNTDTQPAAAPQAACIIISEK